MASKRSPEVDCRNFQSCKWMCLAKTSCHLNDMDQVINNEFDSLKVFGTQPSSVNLFLREEKLRQIHYYLFELQDTKKSTLVLYGMSGVGKTQIARKYCEVYHNFYKNIVWIDAAFGKLQTSINNLCQTLGLVVKDSNGRYFDLEVVIETIHSHYKNEKTLFIFDDVDDESVRNIRMYISKKPNSFSLITSQWRMWSDSVNQMLIDVFSPEDAFTYIKNNIKTNTEEKLRELIKELGFHPFAINQAIKYINMHKVTIETYISRYKLHPIEILDNEKFRTEEESKSPIKAINLVLKKLENNEIIPLKIINCLSYCDGQNISKHFLIQISKYMEISEEYLIDDAIGLLQNYSLLDCLSDDKYTIHELTKLSCRYFQIKNSTTNIYLALIESYFKFEFKKAKDHVDDGNHFVIHFLHMFRNNIKRMSKTFHRYAGKINHLLTRKSLFLETIEILKAVESFNVKTYGENDGLTLDTKNHIANCLYKIGKHKEALKIHYSVDKIQTEFLGIDHPSTMTTKHCIAMCLCEMLKYYEALEIYCSVEKMKTKILGVNHLSTLVTKNNIAICFVGIGKYNEALQIYYPVEKILIENFGIDHPSTMTIKNNIAMCLCEMGKCNKALEIYYSVDKLQTEILGINHSSTIATKSNIASCLFEIGKYDEALEIYCSLDKIKTEILGINHPSTTETKNNTAKCLCKIGKFNEALEFYYSVDKMNIEVLGINHRSTMATKNNIAIYLEESGKYKEALEFYYAVDKIQTEILGINHLFTINTKRNIACCVKKLEKS
ncbi:uncharacterized protein LOC105847487 isoform X2 [Hydra vulgaris]|uniref:uncharacterized protein LOC105847487 isoform X2 n=1 Tax=Hydra vulgaris TaxID=6087 RepID=UPI001F5E536D|nr:uncharacterized protein LOC105847487 isoform X2 [Hydra vulgaris]XP_047146368.1 uncharacterized protein LOC105847487 isoform X2 [Hydra vulgaris]